MHNNYLMEQLGQIRRQEVEHEFREVNRRQLKPKKWIHMLRSLMDAFDAYYSRYVKRHVARCAESPCCE